MCIAKFSKSKDKFLQFVLLFVSLVANRVQSDMINESPYDHATLTSAISLYAGFVMKLWQTEVHT